MKLLDPLGGLLATGGNLSVHSRYVLTYSVLLFHGLGAEEKKDAWWWLGTHIIMFYTGFFIIKNAFQITLMKGLMYWSFIVSLLWYWYMIFSYAIIHFTKAI
jgi:hypothetical protein